MEFTIDIIIIILLLYDCIMHDNQARGDPGADSGVRESRNGQKKKKSCQKKSKGFTHPFF